jgi:hypothetical protein
MYIPEMTQEGYTIITGDWAQRTTRGKKSKERELYIEHRSIAFWLPKSFSGLQKKSKAPDLATKWRQASFLMKAWPNIVYKAATAQPGYLFDVLENCSVQRTDI